MGDSVGGADDADGEDGNAPRPAAEVLAAASWGVTHCLHPDPGTAFREAFESLMETHFPVLHIATVRYIVRWAVVEDDRGAYDWSLPDEWMRWYGARGIEVHVHLICDHHLYVDGAAEPRANNHPPKDEASMARWKDFVRAVVRRYGFVDGPDSLPGLTVPAKVYQYGNEVLGHPEFWEATVDDYVSAQNETYRTIKEADPESVVLLGCSGSGSPIHAAIHDGIMCDDLEDSCEELRADPEVAAEAEAFARILAAAEYDAVDTHLYHKYEWIPYRVAWIRRHTDKPLVSTESGGPSLRLSEYTGALHAQDTMKRLALALGTGCLRYHQWNLVEMLAACFPPGGCGSTGNSRTAFIELVDCGMDNPRPKPGYHAWAFLTEHFGHVESARLLDPYREGDDLRAIPGTDLVNDVEVVGSGRRWIVSWYDGPTGYETESRSIAVNRTTTVTVYRPALGPGDVVTFGEETYVPLDGAVVVDVGAMPVLVEDDL